MKEPVSPTRTTTIPIDAQNGQSFGLVETMLKLGSRDFRCSILDRVAAVITPIKASNYGTIDTRNEPSLITCRSLGQRCLTMVSTTRGVPSTSIDLKEALCEKIPLHYDLLRKFRSHNGSSVVSQITVDDLYNGLRGVRCGVRETSEDDPLHGLRYRGLTIPEVLGLLPRRGNAPSPEAVFWLLLTGDVPTYEQTAALVADWTARRQKRKNWWVDCGDGYFVGKIIEALPRNVGPLGRLSVALTALGRQGERLAEATGARTMRFNDWEQTYEDGMEFLAALPAIVGLVRRAGENIKGDPEEDGDWVDFFLRCSNISADTFDEKKTTLGGFLRLYIATNADDDGGTPSARVTEILGGSRAELSKALAAGVLAFFREPSTGTMLQAILIIYETLECFQCFVLGHCSLLTFFFPQCMEFQLKLHSVLGRRPSEEALRDFVRTFFEKENNLVGHKEAAVRDPRYKAFSDFADEYLAEDAGIKLSKDVSRVFSSITKSTTGREFWPEQNSLAAPIFRSHGLEDMEFNQVLLCMSRALGAVASIIWTRAVDVPVEHPKFQSTYTYVDLFRDVRKNNKLKRAKVKYIKHRKNLHSLFSIDR